MSKIENVCPLGNSNNKKIKSGQPFKDSHLSQYKFNAKRNNKEVSNYLDICEALDVVYIDFLKALDTIPYKGSL